MSYDYASRTVSADWPANGIQGRQPATGNAVSVPIDGDDHCASERVESEVESDDRG
jgi:hypothetical protein